MVLRVLYHLERTPLSRFPNGPGCTSGRLLSIAGQPVRAPLSRQECAAMRVEVLAETAAGWSPVLDEIQIAEGFELKGDGTVARVISAGADVALAFAASRYFSAYSIPPLLWQSLAQLGAQWSTHYGGLYVTESLLRIGDEVVVCGYGDRELAPRQGKPGGYRDIPASRSLIRSDPAMPLAISNNGLVLEASEAAVSPRLL